MRSKGDTPPLLVGAHICPTTVKINMANPQIIIPQPTGLENLSNKKGSKGDSRIFLGVGGLRVVGNESRSDGGDGGRVYGKRRQELGATGRSNGEETVVRLYCMR